jgi:hypothetical protein
MRSRNDEQTESWNRRSSILAAWGTFVAGVAAAVGLFLTVMALQDQRQQQDTEERRETTAQASRVAVWQDNLGNLVIENRSIRPIYAVQIGTPLGEEVMHIDALLESFPPCTRLEISADEIIEGMPPYLIPKPEAEWRSAVYFDDADANEWMVSSTGLREESGLGGDIKPILYPNFRPEYSAMPNEECQ